MTSKSCFDVGHSGLLIFYLLFVFNWYFLWDPKLYWILLNISHLSSYFYFLQLLFILLLMFLNRSLANCSWFMDTFSLISPRILISFKFVINSLSAFFQGVLFCLFALVSDFNIRGLPQDLLVLGWLLTLKKGNWKVDWKPGVLHEFCQPWVFWEVIETKNWKNTTVHICRSFLLGFLNFSRYSINTYHMLIMYQAEL